jgi:hypothetical protein
MCGNGLITLARLHHHESAPPTPAQQPDSRPDIDSLRTPARGAPIANAA